MLNTILLTVVMVCARGDEATEAIHAWNAVSWHGNVIFIKGCTNESLVLDSTRGVDGGFAGYAYPGLRYAWCGYNVEGPHAIANCAHELGHLMGLTHPGSTPWCQGTVVDVVGQEPPSVVVGATIMDWTTGCPGTVYCPCIADGEQLRRK